MALSDIKPDEGLRLRLMGVPEVSLDGVPLTFSRRRAFALLVYLAVTGHVHTRDVLATLLSGEAPGPQARKRLSNALAELRQLVGDYIVTTRDTAAFNTSLPSWMDVRTFRDAVGAGLEGDGLDDLETTLDLYREQFLSGLTVSEASGFDEWVMLQGEALRTQAVQALQVVVVRALRMKEDVIGVAAARRLVALEPLLEDAHGQLMTLLARAGQRQEALAQYEICRSLLEDELGEEPSAEIVALYHRLRMAHVTPPHGLPVREGVCVGRETETGVLVARLPEPEIRLITLVGLGGSGKSRLALEVAHNLAEPSMGTEQPFPDGIFFVPLDGVPPSDVSEEVAVSDVLRHIGSVISPALDDTGRASIALPDQLQTALGAKVLLLVLDGVDCLPPGVATAVVELLLSSSQATLLLTSREALQTAGENVLAVGDLELPSTPDALELTAAGKLLLLEAERNRLDFYLRDEDRPHVMRLCHMVGGLPLALVLLAQWLPKLTPEDLVHELERTLDVLGTSDPRIPERQRAISAILDESWSRLSDEERRVTRQLSVFQDGFDRAAAREVVSCSPQHITRLIDLGMVTQPQRSRYQAHELVRRYASEQLSARVNELAETLDRHAHYYARLSQSLGDGTRTRLEAQRDVLTETQNVHSAWNYALGQKAWEMLGDLGDAHVSYFRSAGLLDEGVGALGEAIDALRTELTSLDTVTPDLQRLLVQLQCHEASLLIEMSQYSRAESILSDAVASSESLECLSLTARLTYLWGANCTYLGRLAAGSEHIERAMSLAKSARLPELEIECLLILSRMTYARGDTREALRAMQDVVGRYRNLDNTPGEIAALAELGRMVIEDGDQEWARRLLQRATVLLEAAGGAYREESALLSARGLLGVVAGRYTEAEEHFSLALKINRRIGWKDAAALNPTLGECGCLAYLARLARIQGDTGTAHARLSEALALCQGIESPYCEALILIEMSLLHHAESDDQLSRHLASQALRLMNERRHSQFLRFALMALGHAENGLGHLNEAEDAYSRALSLDRDQGNRWRTIESTADLAGVALATGNRLRASALLDSVLSDLLPGTPSAVDEPARMYLTAYEILHAIGDTRDYEVLETGCRLLQERTAGIPDEMRRLLFLQRVGPNRDLLHARTGNGFERETVSHVNVHSGS